MIDLGDNVTRRIWLGRLLRATARERVHLERADREAVLAEDWREHMRELDPDVKGLVQSFLGSFLGPGLVAKLAYDRAVAHVDDLAAEMAKGGT